MFADVISLRYWKSERADITTCEDALRANTQHGLFCVADGAGSTLFSNIWADILVEQFMQNPLMSSDPFEMEWWIRQAQKRYRERVPQSDKLNWSARQKALEQGAYSTLATVYFTRSEKKMATAELLVIGDSCILIGNALKQQITSFPLQHDQDFDRAPYCVPALPKNLNRHALYPRTCEVTFAPGDIIILATDAVARWIVRGGTSGDESNAWNAFLEVARKTERDWQGFVDRCRANQSMVDDDSTASVISLREDGQEAERLGLPDAPSQEIVAARKAEFERARQENNKELVAITYGDGHMLKNAAVVLTDAEKIDAQRVADALREVLQVVRDALNTPNFAAKVEPVWWNHADRLKDEPCAETLRKNLAAQGVHLVRPAQGSSFVQYPAADSSAGKQTPASGIANLPTLPVTTQENGGSLPNLPGGSFQGSTDIESEPTRILAPVLVAEAAQQKQEARLQTFRQALALGDPLAIASTFDPVFASSLTAEEKKRLQGAQDIMQKLSEALKEGTALQKVEAYEASQKPMVDEKNREQLDMAQAFVEALHADRDDQISGAYRKIEFSPLRKHFIITLEEQNRIERARQVGGAIEQFRLVLRSGNATPLLILQMSQKFHGPGSSLSISLNEQYVIDLSERFLQSYQSVQQALQVSDVARLQHFVCLFDALYYSPYRIVYSGDEPQQANAARKYVRPYVPIVLTINAVPITISHVLALFYMKKRYARSHLASLRSRYTPESPERQDIERYIVYWERELERRDWSQAVLNDLIEQKLLEQKIQEEIKLGNSRRGNINLKKDPGRESDELARELLLGKDPRSEMGEFAGELEARGIDASISLAQITEYDLRNALLSLALKRLVERDRKAMPEDQRMFSWVETQLNTAVIHYYERPEQDSPATTEQRRCWLFRWWAIRDSNYAIR